MKTPYLALTFGLLLFGTTALTHAATPSYPAPTLQSVNIVGPGSTGDASAFTVNLGGGSTISLAAMGQALQNVVRGTVTTQQGISSPFTFSKADGVHVSVFPVSQTVGDPYTSPDSVQFGGLAPNMGAQVTIRGAPYGYYDAGALLSLVTTGRDIFGSRAGVNGGFEAGVPAMAGDGDADMVSLYNQISTLPPRFILNNVTYDATHIYPHPALTATQLNQLQKSMWIRTNSVDPTTSILASGTSVTATNVGDITITLTGNVPVQVGMSVLGYRDGVNGGTTVISVTQIGGNTVVGISSPLIQEAKESIVGQNLVTTYTTTWPAGSIYGFVTYLKTDQHTVASAVNVGDTALTLNGSYPIPKGSLVAAPLQGVPTGTTVTSVDLPAADAPIQTTLVHLSNPIIQVGNATSWPVGTIYSTGAPVVRDPTLLPLKLTYGSTVTGWAADGTSISVSGWTIPGSGHSSSGQVPGPVLDPSSPFTNPSVSFGTPTNAFANNWVENYDPNAPDSFGTLTHVMDGLEIDQWNFSPKDYDVSFHGITIGETPQKPSIIPAAGSVAQHYAKLTPDSYDLLLAGEMPTMLKIQGGGDTQEIQGDSLLVNGGAGMAQGSTVGTKAEMNEFSAFVDGSNNMRLMTYLYRETATPVGWTNSSVRLGLQVDGTQGTFNGSPMGNIDFNGLNNLGGVALCGNSNVCGVAVNAAGNAVIGTVVTPDINVVTGPASTLGAVSVTSDHVSYIDTNRERLTTWVSRDVLGGTGGWPNASTHIGLQIDGTNGAMNGSQQGNITFNAQGYSGGVSLCGQSGLCGITVDHNGNAQLTAPNTNVTNLISTTLTGNTGGFILPPGGPIPTTLGGISVANEINKVADSNRMRLLTYAQRDVAGAGGWPTTSMHIGLRIDGTSLLTDGSPMGEIVFNPQSTPGGIALRGVAGTGLTVDQSANVQVQNKLYIQGQIVESVANALTGAGTTLATATALTSNYNVVTNCAGPVALPTSAVAGGDVFVFDRCSAQLQVYPDASSSSIEAQSAGSSITMDSGATYHFIRINSGNWMIENSVPYAFTPTMSIGTSAASVTYTSQLGRVKQENGICTFTIQVEYSGLNGTTGAVHISGTPCHPIVGGPIKLQSVNEFGVSNPPLNAVMSSDGSIALTTQGTGSASSDPALDATNLAAAGGFYISGSVFTR